MNFPTNAQVRLEVQKDWTTLANLVANHDGRSGGWGWTPTSGVRVSQSGVLLEVRTLTAQTTGSALSDHAQVPLQTSSTDYQLRGQIALGGRNSTSVTVQASYRCYNASKVLIGTVGTTAHITTTGTTTMPAVTAPVGTRFVAMNLLVSRSGSATTAGDWVTVSNLTMAYGTAAQIFAYTPLATPTYDTITGSTTDIEINREALNLGTLSAIVRDANLDPATNALLVKGRRVRVSALDPLTMNTQQMLFVGTLLNVKVDYELKDPEIPTNRQTRIELSAVDNVSVLANSSRTEGVATVPELPGVLNGLRLPWSVDGSSTSIDAYTVVARNESASALDQVLITRDSQRGEAWVDRTGVLRVFSRSALSNTSVATLAEADYSDLNVDFDSDRLINVVRINLLRLNLIDGQTVETAFGPYVDQESVDKWGMFAADFTVQGISTTGTALQDYANAILTSNANPKRRINTVTLPVKTHSQVIASRALLDLGDVVTVSNTAAAINEAMRITSVKHVITPGKWLVTFGFAAPASSPVPTTTPPVVNAPRLNTDTWTSRQVTQTAAVTKSSTTATTNTSLPGITTDLSPANTSSVYRVTLQADVVISTAGTVNIIELVVDNVALTDPALITSGPAGMRVAGAQTWRITGLAPGTRTIYARTRNTANSTSATVNLAHTTMTVVRES
ncbi:hypothetical protein [Nocardioides nanhaiensis]|uniref:Minor tail protein n=1 Tax=Nocardioides nanhaiensis TaxID=1476871 RepID=A0ABP8WZN2_9ACTN